MLQFDEEAIYQGKFIDNRIKQELDITIKEPGEGVYDNLQDLIIYTDSYIDFEKIKTIVFNNQLILKIDHKLGLFRTQEGVYKISATEQFVVGEQNVLFLHFSFLMEARLYKRMKDYDRKMKNEAEARRKEKGK